MGGVWWIRGGREVIDVDVSFGFDECWLWRTVGGDGCWARGGREHCVVRVVDAACRSRICGVLTQLRSDSDVLCEEMG